MPIHQVAALNIAEQMNQFNVTLPRPAIPRQDRDAHRQEQIRVGCRDMERFNPTVLAMRLPLQILNAVRQALEIHAPLQTHAGKLITARFSVMDRVARPRRLKADVRYSQLQYTNPQHVL